MTLYEECLEALKGNYTMVLNDDRSKILSKLETKFPFSKWGRIDWNKIDRKEEINNVLCIKEELVKENLRAYIIWDEATLPIIESDLFSVIDVIDDITAVSFDTWVFSTNEQFVIEFYHDGEIKIGFSK